MAILEKISDQFVLYYRYDNEINFCNILDKFCIILSEMMKKIDNENY